MPGPLIRPPTKKQVVIGAIAGAVAIGIMALAGSTGRLQSEVEADRRAELLASASPSALPTVAGADCRDIVRDLTAVFIKAQDALNEAAEGEDFVEADLKDAAAEAKDVEGGDDLPDCEKTDPDAGDTLNAGLIAVQDAADEANLSEKEAEDYLEKVEALLALDS